MHNSCSAADSRKAGIARFDEAAAAPILKLSSVLQSFNFLFFLLDIGIRLP
jgi:hypothetical protein